MRKERSSERQLFLSLTQVEACKESLLRMLRMPCPLLSLILCKEITST
uniref:Uncharacterized protein n=1 Tax=Arundo donax TaxID=35708 RepID=A0A0A9AW86_ARUDO